MLRKRTESAPASFASGAPAFSATKDDKERTPLSFPSFCINLYNHIQATNWPKVDMKAKNATGYPRV